MITYEHIPIHIRITNRELIDPDYTPESYRKREHLLNLSRATEQRNLQREIPEQVLWWVSQDSFSRLVPAAGALRISSKELRNAVKNYRRGL